MIIVRIVKNVYGSPDWLVIWLLRNTLSVRRKCNSNKRIARCILVGRDIHCTQAMLEAPSPSFLRNEARFCAPRSCRLQHIQQTLVFHVEPTTIGITVVFGSVQRAALHTDRYLISNWPIIQTNQFVDGIIQCCK